MSTMSLRISSFLLICASLLMCLSAQSDSATLDRSKDTPSSATVGPTTKRVNTSESRPSSTPSNESFILIGERTTSSDSKPSNISTISTEKLSVSSAINLPTTTVSDQLTRATSKPGDSPNPDTVVNTEAPKIVSASTTPSGDVITARKVKSVTSLIPESTTAAKIPITSKAAIIKTTVKPTAATTEVSMVSISTKAAVTAIKTDVLSTTAESPTTTTTTEAPTTATTTTTVAPTTTTTTTKAPTTTTTTATTTEAPTTTTTTEAPTTTTTTKAPTTTTTTTTTRAPSTKTTSTTAKPSATTATVNLTRLKTSSKSLDSASNTEKPTFKSETDDITTELSIRNKDPTVSDKEENQPNVGYNSHEKTLVWVGACVGVLILATLIFVSVICYIRHRRLCADRKQRHEVFQLLDTSGVENGGGVRLDRVNRKKDKAITTGHTKDMPYLEENISY